MSGIKSRASAKGAAKYNQLNAFNYNEICPNIGWSLIVEAAAWFIYCGGLRYV